MNILITGSTGMLAQDIIKEFEKDNILFLTTKDNLDITNKEQVDETISSCKPDVLINCSAYTAVDNAEDEEQKEFCLKINADGVKNLAEACSKNNVTLVHYSTDYIFDGNNESGYTENDITTGPVNYYGYSKYQGEQNILEVAKNNEEFKYYILRISWLYGKGGKNFVKTMINLSKTKPEIGVINDQNGSPTYTVDVAKRTRYILENDLFKGIYHCTNEGKTTWYEFTKKIFEIANINTKLNPLTSEQYPSKAQRPKYSILLNTKIENKMRNWEDALGEYLLKDDIELLIK